MSDERLETIATQALSGLLGNAKITQEMIKGDGMDAEYNQEWHAIVAVDFAKALIKELDKE